MFRLSASHFGDELSTRREGRLLDPPRKPAAHADHGPLWRSRARLIDNGGCEEFERHRSKGDDYMLKIDAAFGEKRKAATGDIAAKYRPEFGLAWQAAIAEGRQKLEALKPPALAVAMVFRAAFGRRRIAQSLPLRFDQLVNDLVEVRVGGGGKDVVHGRQA